MGARLTREELDERYHLSDPDLAFIQASARGDTGRLMLATLLKSRRDFGCFPAPEDVHASTLAHLAAQLAVDVSQAWADAPRRTKSLYRYQSRGAGPTCPLPPMATWRSAFSPAPSSKRPKR